MITMSGYDRVFEVPRTLRVAARHCDGATLPAVKRLAAGRVTAWDMLSSVLDAVPGAVKWADKSITAAITAGSSTAVCTDCDDTGYYGMPDPNDDDTLIRLIRRVGDDAYESLAADGRWADYRVPLESPALEVLDLDTAQDLADTVLAGAAGLARRYCWPIAFLPPCPILAAGPGLPDDTVEPVATDDGWVTFAVVDELDTGAVLNLVRIKPGPEMERYEAGEWIPDELLLSQLQGVKPPPLVELDEAQIADVIDQIDSSADAVAGGALVADAPLTVSPDPRAEKLRRYWTTGKGAMKIRWGSPGDFTRCARYLAKYMPGRAEGYCANLHKRSTGMWPGSKANRGSLAGSAVLSIEEALVAAIQAQTWSGENGRTVTMAGIKDGIYEETVDDVFAQIVNGLTAGAFPVAPPTDWFDDPKFTELTPLTVEDTGQVYGHLASFDMPHIGLPGKVRAPRSNSGYAYFNTGVLPTESGKKVSVGQLTLAGGHAPLNASPGAAVAHYDNTNSAVCDVHVGEDRHGVWFAGALRPDTTPEQIRTFMASALSGDWRPINGGLELVACCSVNVPGFPIARAMAAGGALISLVAAGARPIAMKAASMRGDEALLARIAALESAVFEATGPETMGIVDVETPVDISAAEPAEETAVDRARKLVAERKKAAKPTREELRARVHGTAEETVAAGGARPKALKSGGPLTAASEENGDDDDDNYEEWQHPRGIDGTWVEKDDDVNIDGRRAKVINIGPEGTTIRFIDPPFEEVLIPVAEVSNKIQVAPQSIARLEGDREVGISSKNRKAAEAEAKKKGKGGGGGGGGGGAAKKEDAKKEGGGGGGGGGGVDKAAAEKAKADKAAATDATRQAKATATAEKTAASDKAKAEKTAASDATKAAKATATESANTVLLPSKVTEGAKVRIGNSPEEWTVSKAYDLPDGTRVVDIQSKDRTETRYPITGKNGQRITQGQAKLSLVAAGGAPPHERPSLGGYPIADGQDEGVKDLKKAIQAYGRAKESERAATRRHIITQARRLKRTDLIPEDWRPKVACGGVLVGGPLRGIYQEWQHPRGFGGKWIEKGGDVNISTSRGGQGKRRRAKILELTPDGPVVQYSDGNKETETIPLEQVSHRVETAPKALSRLDAPEPSAPEKPAEKPAAPGAYVPQRDADGKLIVSPESAAMGKEIYDRAVAAEPELTAKLAALVEDNDPENYSAPKSGGGGELYGYKYRLKAEAGISEKIERYIADEGLTREQGAKEIKDANRYTIHYPEDSLGPNAQRILDSIAADPNTERINVKNTWPPEMNRAYKGINVNVWTKDGLVYEIQFHTPNSQAVKDKMHQLYEDQRTKTVAGSPEWQKYEDEMKDMAKTLPMPTGAAEVKTPKIGGPPTSQPEAVNKLLQQGLNPQGLSDIANDKGIPFENAMDMTPAQRLANVAKMYGTNSPQYKAAQAKQAPKTVPAAKKKIKSPTELANERLTIKEGDTVLNGKGKTPWTVTKKYKAKDGTIVVDIKSAGGGIQRGISLSDPDGKPMDFGRWGLKLAG